MKLAFDPATDRWELVTTSVWGGAELSPDNATKAPEGYEAVGEWRLCSVVGSYATSAVQYAWRRQIRKGSAR